MSSYHHLIYSTRYLPSPCAIEAFDKQLQQHDSSCPDLHLQRFHYAAENLLPDCPELDRATQNWFKESGYAYLENSKLIQNAPLMHVGLLLKAILQTGGLVEWQGERLLDLCEKLRQRLRCFRKLDS